MTLVVPYDARASTHPQTAVQTKTRKGSRRALWQAEEGKQPNQKSRPTPTTVGVAIMPILGSSDKRRTNAREAQHDDYEGFEVIARRMWVILPSSWFRATWDWILVIFVVYNMISIPLEM